MDPQQTGTSSESTSFQQNISSTVRRVGRVDRPGMNPNPNPQSRISRARSIVVEAQTSGSIRDVVEETRDEVPSLSKYESFNFPTKFKGQSEIDDLVNKFGIPEEYMCYLPTKAARSCNATQDLCVFSSSLDAGLRFPLHNFIPQLIRSYNIHPAQIMPNGWRLIICFMVRCIKLGVEPGVRIFRRMFQMKSNTKQHPGWVVVNHRYSGRSSHIVNTESFPDSVSGWKDSFFYMRKPNGVWSDTFPMEWGSADDSSLTNWELTPEEDEVRQALEADGGTTHAAFLLCEQTLADCGLSPLRGEGTLPFLTLVFRNFF